MLNGLCKKVNLCIIKLINSHLINKEVIIKVRKKTCGVTKISKSTHYRRIDLEILALRMKGISTKIKGEKGKNKEKLKINCFCLHHGQNRFCPFWGSTKLLNQTEFQSLFLVIVL